MYATLGLPMVGSDPYGNQRSVASTSRSSTAGVFGRGRPATSAPSVSQVVNAIGSGHVRGVGVDLDVGPVGGGVLVPLRDQRRRRPAGDLGVVAGPLGLAVGAERRQFERVS